MSSASSPRASSATSKSAGAETSSNFQALLSENSRLMQELQGEMASMHMLSETAAKRRIANEHLSTVISTTTAAPSSAVESKASANTYAAASHANNPLETPIRGGKSNGTSVENRPPTHNNNASSQFYLTPSEAAAELSTNALTKFMEGMKEQAASASASASAFAAASRGNTTTTNNKTKKQFNNHPSSSSPSSSTITIQGTLSAAIEPDAPSIPPSTSVSALDAVHMRLAALEAEASAYGAKDSGLHGSGNSTSVDASSSSSLAAKSAKAATSKSLLSAYLSNNNNTYSSSSLSNSIISSSDRYLTANTPRSRSNNNNNAKITMASPSMSTLSFRHALAEANAKQPPSERSIATTTAAAPVVAATTADGSSQNNFTENDTVKANPEAVEDQELSVLASLSSSSETSSTIPTKDTNTSTSVVATDFGATSVKTTTETTTATTHQPENVVQVYAVGPPLPPPSSPPSSAITPPTPSVDKLPPASSSLRARTPVSRVLLSDMAEANNSNNNVSSSGSNTSNSTATVSPIASSATRLFQPLDMNTISLTDSIELHTSTTHNHSDPSMNQYSDESKKVSSNKAHSSSSSSSSLPSAMQTSDVLTSPISERIAHYRTATEPADWDTVMIAARSRVFEKAQQADLQRQQHQLQEAEQNFTGLEDALGMTNGFDNSNNSNNNDTVTGSSSSPSSRQNMNGIAASPSRARSVSPSSSTSPHYHHNHTHYSPTKNGTNGGGGPNDVLPPPPHVPTGAPIPVPNLPHILAEARRLQVLQHRAVLEAAQAIAAAEAAEEAVRVAAAEAEAVAQAVAKRKIEAERAEKRLAAATAQAAATVRAAAAAAALHSRNNVNAKPATKSNNGDKHNDGNENSSSPSQPSSMQRKRSFFPATVHPDDDDGFGGHISSSSANTTTAGIEGIVNVQTPTGIDGDDATPSVNEEGTLEERIFARASKLLADKKAIHPNKKYSGKKLFKAAAKSILQARAAEGPTAEEVKAKLSGARTKGGANEALATLARLAARRENARNGMTINLGALQFQSNALHRGQMARDVQSMLVQRTKEIAIQEQMQRVQQERERLALSTPAPTTATNVIAITTTPVTGAPASPGMFAANAINATGTRSVTNNSTANANDITTIALNSASLLSPGVVGAGGGGSSSVTETPGGTKKKGFGGLARSVMGAFSITKQRDAGGASTASPAKQ